MNVRACAVILGGMLISTMMADDMALKNQEKKTFKGRSVQSFQMDYLLFLPQGYKEDKKKQWPLMLFLHGAGERGKDLAKVAVHGPPKLVKEKTDFPFILVSPQCPAGESWSDDALLGLLDEVMKKHRVDQSRVYLTGLSMGGYGTWSLGLNYPDRFAAIAPICGGGNFLPVLLPGPGKQAALKKLPVWAFHGAKDTAVPLSESERMVNAVKHIGNQNVKFTVYPEAEHDSWTETYRNQELYDWLLQHKASVKSTAAKGKKATASEK
ncbi:MAG: carboxylesterase family protein [Limisphaerales bacterium]